MPLELSQRMKLSIAYYCHPDTASKPLPRSYTSENSSGIITFHYCNTDNIALYPEELLDEVNRSFDDFKKYLEQLKTQFPPVSKEQAMLIATAETQLLPFINNLKNESYTPLQLTQLFRMVKLAECIINNPSNTDDQSLLANLINEMEGKRNKKLVFLGAALMAFTTFCIIAAIAFFAIGIASAFTGGGLPLSVASIGFSMAIIAPVRDLIHSLRHKNDYDYEKTRSPFSKGYQLIKDTKKMADHSRFPVGVLAAQGFYATTKEMKRLPPKVDNAQTTLKN